MSRYRCSKQGLIDYLERKGCGEFATQIACEFERVGYINDLKSAEACTNSLSGRYGWREIERRLLQKGYPRDVIEKVKESFELTEETELETALRLLERRFGGRNKDELKNDKDRIYRFLLRRGFSLELARKAYEKLSESSE